MDDLENELTKRTTIKFSVPIKSEEIETRFFGYLEEALGVATRWAFSGFGHGPAEDIKRERYLDKINLSVSQRGHPFNFASYEFQRSRREDYFDAIRLSTPGCDDLEELRAMPSGEGQLELTDKLRIVVDSYFSQRWKIHR